MKTAWFFALLVSLAQYTGAAVIRQSLYINTGLFTTVDSAQFPYYGLNQTNQFNPQATVVQAALGDTVEFMVHNTDVKPHELRIWHTTHAPVFQPVLLPGDSALYSVQFHDAGLFILYDAREFPKYAYMGLAAMVLVTGEGESGGGHGGSGNTIGGGHFIHWNIREHQKAFNISLAEGKKVEWKSYEPDYFTINGLSYPQVHNDHSTAIEGKVGDTFYVCIANTGQSIHSIHFHGFHTVAVYSSDPKQLGWEKDTWGIESYQTMILRLIPDKPGLYPVHDHNLVALTGGGRFPNGMMVMMNIKP